MQTPSYEDTIKFIENNLINKLFEYFKTGHIEIKPSEYIDLFAAVQTTADIDVTHSGKLFEYYQQKIENYIVECKNKLIKEGKTNIIDEFLLHTKNIYFFIFSMYRVFCYLDRFYTKAKKKPSLPSTAMNLYKSIFYEVFKDNIQDEINNLKNEEKEGNKEASSKIQSIMNIMEDTKLSYPKLIRENNKLKWIEDP